MALAAEAAGRRTHLRAAELAERPSLPTYPDFCTVLYVCLCGPVLAGALLAFLPIRPRRCGRAMVILAIPPLVVLLGLAVLGTTLRLRHPAQYEQWRSSPVRYVGQAICKALGSG